MQFEPTPDQQGRWEEDERRRFELLAALDDAESDILAGRYTDYSDETLPRLADELKREARNNGRPDGLLVDPASATRHLDIGSIAKDTR